MLTEEETGDDIDLERDLVDYEMEQRHKPLPEKRTDTGKTPFERTSQTIATALEDIRSGRSQGQHPALEAIVGRQLRHRGQYLDIRPPLRERVAVIEHRADYVTKEITELRRAGNRYVTQEELREIGKRVDHAHTRIDRDVLPAIRDLRSNAAMKLTVTIIVLLLSMVANIIAIYRYFIK